MTSWYVIKTKPRAEHQVVGYLGNKGIETYLPLTRRRPREAPSVPLFPGYFFCHLGQDPEHWLLARWSPGIHYILGYGDSPTSVPDDFVAALRDRLERELATPLVKRFQSGERVVITSGPFADVDAIFDKMLSASGRTRVLISLVNRLAGVEVDVNFLRKAG
ncbi:MAG: hypothetical protein HY329_23260 [Chloroflexi bacterium]|nr:hypothetical protein [Chloroflexota bacterium]